MAANATLSAVPGAVAPPPPVATFDTDPLAFLFASVKDAAHGLAGDLLPWLLSATQPDLSAAWFLEAYRISFAVAVFLWAVLLLWNLVRAARRLISGPELAESFTTYSLLFLGGAMYGPAAGWVVVRFFGALSQSLIGWASGGSTTAAVEGLSATIDATEPGGIVGGVVVALILMSLMVLGLLLVALVLTAATITLYFTGALLPLALVWLVDPAHRRTGTRLLMAWVAVLATAPLLFFLLGVALRLTAAQTGAPTTDPRIAQLAALSAAALAMILAALAPFLLLHLAPLRAPAWPAAEVPARAEPAPTGESVVARVARLQADRPADAAAGTVLPLLANTYRPLPAEPGPVQRAAMAQHSRTRLAPGAARAAPEAEAGPDTGRPPAADLAPRTGRPPAGGDVAPATGRPQAGGAEPAPADGKGPADASADGGGER
ncbi:hypothetical protein [Georgenia sp. AZ-5]|uniref:hypothetical protein n=1 Tax=Georgenia sp. AZ-5 TaxID=3367526 RepID=UPI003754B7F9